MSIPILATKLYVPPPRTNIVLRPQLVKRLNAGLHGKLTLISAPAGFGKTTLVSEWVAECGPPVAWLSLDEGDNDPIRFLTYFTEALRTIVATIGEGVLRTLQSPQPPPAEKILTALLNEIITIPNNFILILDDYHIIDAKPVDSALTFLIEHLPPQMHLVITTREDPPLPVARLRARNELSELRITDLRFTSAEAAEFLNSGMGLNLSSEDINALETRTEGWVAGLQLAAISLQRHQDATRFIKAFTGNHHFVLDYLVEEVLHRQPESIQTFLLQTSILERMCGSLCDAVLHSPAGSGQETLAYLERANLFIVPLDNERRWYRYHHLFAELLRQRLPQSFSEDAENKVNELHIRASTWYEDNELILEAFHHAAAAGDIPRAERLLDNKSIPRHFRGAVTTIMDWLESLPTSVMNSRPWLWWKYASLLLVNGQTTGVEEKLDAAEAALQGVELDDKLRNLIGQIAAARATLALTRYQVDKMFTQSRRALEYLAPDNLAVRTSAKWSMGFAYMLMGDRAGARRSLTEAISLSQISGDIFTTILATIGLGQVQEAENQLYMAAETFQQVLRLSGDPPLQIIYEAYLGLAHIAYEWNDLDAAEQHIRQSLSLARQYDSVIDRFIVCEVFLARVKLAQGDVDEAAEILVQASQSARQKNYVYRIPEVAAAQVVTMLRQGDITAAAHLTQTHEIPVSQARVYLAQGDTAAALTILTNLRQQFEAKKLEDERLRVMVLQVTALYKHGEKDEAVGVLGEALRLAEPGGFIRVFVDEGVAIAELLVEALNLGMMPDYIGKLLAAFEAEHQSSVDHASVSVSSDLIEPLSQRELEVLQLIAQGLSNYEISERLFLALSTVKGHNQKIFDKLAVKRRTEAIARARELGLL